MRCFWYVVSRADDDPARGVGPRMLIESDNDLAVRIEALGLPEAVALYVGTSYSDAILSTLDVCYVHRLPERVA